MTEEGLMDILAELLQGMKEDPSNKYSAGLFKEVIKNNVPVWTAINSTPAVAFYTSSSTYTDNRSSEGVVSEVIIYVYNRHRTKGLSLDDILSPLITRVRAKVKTLVDEDPSIIASNVVSSSKDGGTILPYTIAELVLKVESVHSPLACE